jgi:hypothetical protein
MVFASAVKDSVAETVPAVCEFDTDNSLESVNSLLDEVPDAVTSEVSVADVESVGLCERLSLGSTVSVSVVVGFCDADTVSVSVGRSESLTVDVRCGDADTVSRRV